MYLVRCFRIPPPRPCSKAWARRYPRSGQRRRATLQMADKVSANCHSKGHRNNRHTPWSGSHEGEYLQRSQSRRTTLPFSPLGKNDLGSKTSAVASLSGVRHLEFSLERSTLEIRGIVRLTRPQPRRQRTPPQVRDEPNTRTLPSRCSGRPHLL